MKILAEASVYRNHLCQEVTCFLKRSVYPRLHIGDKLVGQPYVFLMRPVYLPIFHYFIRCCCRRFAIIPSTFFFDNKFYQWNSQDTFAAFLNILLHALLTLIHSVRCNLVSFSNIFVELTAPWRTRWHTTLGCE